MLGGFINAFVNVEEVVKEKIQKILVHVSKELNCNHKELSVMITPKNEDFEPKFLIFRVEENKPKYIRELKSEEIKKILTDE